MNKIILVGRLTNEPDLKLLPGGGTAVTTFTLAVDRPFKDKDGNKQTDFINCVAWRKNAETIANYVKKGHRLGVVGSLQTRNYEKDGVKHYITEVLVESIEFLQGKSEGQQTAPSKNGTPKSEPVYDPIEDDSDIPF